MVNDERHRPPWMVHTPNKSMRRVRNSFNTNTHIPIRCYIPCYIPRRYPPTPSRYSPIQLTVSIFKKNMQFCRSRCDVSSFHAVSILYKVTLSSLFHLSISPYRSMIRLWMSILFSSILYIRRSTPLPCKCTTTEGFFCPARCTRALACR